MLLFLKAVTFRFIVKSFFGENKVVKCWPSNRNKEVRIQNTLWWLEDIFCLALCLLMTSYDHGFSPGLSFSHRPKTLVYWWISVQIRVWMARQLSGYWSNLYPFSWEQSKRKVLQLHVAIFGPNFDPISGHMKQILLCVLVVLCTGGFVIRKPP